MDLWALLANSETSRSWGFAFFRVIPKLFKTAPEC